jgi:hypothetical protein
MLSRSSLLSDAAKEMLGRVMLATPVMETAESVIARFNIERREGSCGSWSLIKASFS